MSDPLDGRCSPELRIDTPEQALAFAKQIVKVPAGQDWAAYVAAIESDPRCCSAVYGPRQFEGVSRDGWQVFLSAAHLPNRHEHAIEFDSCRAVSYNGGVNL